jgi:protein-tyrosine phosphatase
MTVRRLPFEGAVNFRDIGGYPTLDGRITRWNAVYRSDSLADLTPADMEAFAALGIRTLCDFRTEHERSRKPNRLPEGHRITIAEVSFIPTGTVDMLASISAGEFGPDEIREEVTTHYRKFVRDHGEQYRRMFDLILEEDGLPFLMHCTSGKDRTGFGAASLLTALRVPREQVVADYVMTNDYRRDIAHLFPNAVSQPALQTLTSASARYIETALDEIETAFGSEDAWLESMGVDGRRRQMLIERLTVKA